MKSCPAASRRCCAGSFLARHVRASVEHAALTAPDLSASVWKRAVERIELQRVRPSPGQQSMENMRRPARAEAVERPRALHGKRARGCPHRCRGASSDDLPRAPARGGARASARQRRGARARARARALTARPSWQCLSLWTVEHLAAKGGDKAPPPPEHTHTPKPLKPLGPSSSASLPPSLSPPPLF